MEADILTSLKNIAGTLKPCLEDAKHLLGPPGFPNGLASSSWHLLAPPCTGGPCLEDAEPLSSNPKASKEKGNCSRDGLKAGFLPDVESLSFGEKR